MWHISKFFLLLVSLPLNAVTSPTQDLDLVVLEVNGGAVPVKSGETVQVVWGDEIMVKSAHLRGIGKSPETVNFVGFKGKDHRRPYDDRGYLIKTHKDLLASWSVFGKGKRYRIKVSSTKKVHGTVFVELMPPKLSYVDLSVEGEEKTRVLREGEMLSVSSRDKFKVTRFATNIENVEKGVAMKLIPVTKVKEPGDKAASVYEMVFYRYEKEFARIPIYIKN